MIEISYLRSEFLCDERVSFLKILLQMNKINKIHRALVIFIFCIFSLSSYDQERYDKVTIYSEYGYVSVLLSTGYDHNENYIRVNSPISFSTREPNFIYELYNLINEAEKVPVLIEDDYHFMCYLVVDFIRNDRILYSAGFNEYGQYRIFTGVLSPLYEADENTVKYLKESFPKFLNQFGK